MLQEGALQPVIGLLSSKCTESQREAALLLGQFATTTDDYKAKIVQRGAVPPLIAMLGQGDTQLREMAAFALGRLAQNADNQAGIVQVPRFTAVTFLPSSLLFTCTQVLEAKIKHACSIQQHFCAVLLSGSKCALPKCETYCRRAACSR